ncbi:hypothetical protein GCM10010350_19520 [Streptomyces galilaeus]|nr:hypothetical protein GCM10010350_19520 [Streptomyces galilaeus]
MSLKGSTRAIPESRLLIRVWPIPAEASTTTDSVMVARMAQRGRFLGAGRTGRRRAGRGGREAGDRGGVGDKRVTSGRRPYEAYEGSREHRRPTGSAARRRAPGGAHRCPPFAVT